MKGNLLHVLGLLILAQIAFVYFVGFSIAPASPLVGVAPKKKNADSSPIVSQQLSPNNEAAAGASANAPIPQNVQEMVEWMQKQTPPPNRVFLAHVGKTGGETIRAALRVGCTFLGNRRVKHACHEKLFQAFYGPDIQIKGEPILSQSTTGFHHYLDLKPKGENLRATHFLFAIRHPVQRFESWFRYVAPANCATVPDKAMAASCRVAAEIRQQPNSFQAQFFGCFPSMHTVSFVLEQWQRQDETLLSNQTAAQCAQMLADTLQGHTGTHMAGHMIANLQYYHHFTLGGGKAVLPDQSSLPRELTRRTAANRGTGDARNTPVLVVRTPHLWDDMATADRALGGTGYFSQSGLKVSHQSESFGEKAVVPAGHALSVCCALSDELAVYKELVERAMNLDDAARQATLTEALDVCQVDSWEGLIDACNLRNDPTSLLHRPPFSPAVSS
eukprot:scaffold6562_cov163-Amphora_coffeaeformis.AAC.3